MNIYIELAFIIVWTFIVGLLVYFESYSAAAGAAYLSLALGIFGLRNF